jgi:hypothetical protein
MSQTLDSIRRVETPVQGNVYMDGDTYFVESRSRLGRQPVFRAMAMAPDGAIHFVKNTGRFTTKAEAQGVIDAVLAARERDECVPGALEKVLVP